MNLSRRRLLSTVGGSLSVAVLAGCVSDGPGSDGTDTTGGTTDGTDTTGGTTDGSNTTDGTRTDGGFDGLPGDTDPVETFTVGSRENVAFPDNHRERPVDVWNNADRSRTLAVRLERGGETVLEERVDLDAKTYVRVLINEPADYVLAAGVAGESLTTIDYGRDMFDCNTARTTVVVLPDGSVDHQTMTTLMACPGPGIADPGASFEAGEGTCGTDDVATVTYADETVAVDGSIRAPNPCHGARLEGATLTDGVLTVAVEVTDQTTDACVECVGTIPYTVRVPFADEYPSETRVVHVRDGDRDTVTIASRP